MSPRGLRRNKPNDTPPWASGFQSPEKWHFVLWHFVRAVVVTFYAGVLTVLGHAPLAHAELRTFAPALLSVWKVLPPDLPLIQTSFPERPLLATLGHTTTPFAPPRDPYAFAETSGSARGNP